MLIKNTPGLRAIYLTQTASDAPGPRYCIGVSRCDLPVSERERAVRRVCGRHCGVRGSVRASFAADATQSISRCLVVYQWNTDSVGVLSLRY